MREFVADERMADLAVASCERVNPDIHVRKGRVVSGDQFISSNEVKERLIAEFRGDCTEMEGAAIAHAATLNNIPFVIIRAISDKADNSAQMDYPEFRKSCTGLCDKIIDSITPRCYGRRDAQMKRTGNPFLHCQNAGNVKRGFFDVFRYHSNNENYSEHHLLYLLRFE